MTFTLTLRGDVPIMLEESVDDSSLVRVQRISFMFSSSSFSLIC